MIKSYLKAAVRNLLLQKSNTIINVTGVTLGIAVFLLIIQYVAFENSYDTFYKNSDRIYRVRNDRIYSDKHDKSAGCPPAVAPTLKKEFPEVQEAARLKGTDVVFIDADKKINENLEKVYYADPSFLKIFSLKFLSGLSNTVLDEPFTVVISKSISQKYFGDINPAGKIITLNNEIGKQNYKVTGLFEDIPENSHLKFCMLISYSSLILKNKDAEYYWGWNAFNTYVLLEPDVDYKAFEAKLPVMVEKYKNYESGYKRRYILQPVTSIHLNSHLRFEPEVNGKAATVKFLTIIAVFVLILAWVNYINLSTSRALTRAKEVGIRKILGASKLRLIKQFMTESFLVNSAALIFAIVIDEIILPYFRDMTGKPLSLNLLQNNWIFIIPVFIAGIFLSGIYPAFILSSFNPLSIVKSKPGRTQSGIDMRKILVIFQFTVSIALIVSTIIVYKQLSYMRNSKLGINIDQVLILKAPAGAGIQFNTANNFKDALLIIPGVVSVSASSSIPGKGYSNASSGVRRFGSNPEEGTQGLFMDVDENYFKLYDIPLLAGRNFNRESRFNSEIMINEEAVKVYGFKSPEDAVNKKLTFDGFDGQSIEIVGVMKNYHQESLKSSLQPTIFNPINASDNNFTKYFSVKIKNNNIGQLINHVKVKWDEILPNTPFEYEFLDETFNSQYKSDQQFGKVFSLFTALAIIISCLGLFGLSSYTSLQRTKEIGIRKVVGASLSDILLMLIKDYVKWVFIGSIFACPIALVVMKKWLEDFAYRTEINFWIFVFAGGIALIIAIITISFQAIKAATANPVKSLIYE